MAIVAVYVNVFDWHTTLECVDYPNLLMARVEEICTNCLLYTSPSPRDRG